MENVLVKKAQEIAPDTYYFFRGYIRGVIDTLHGEQLQDEVDFLIDLAVAEIICAIGLKGDSVAIRSDER